MSYNDISQSPKPTGYNGVCSFEIVFYMEWIAGKLLPATSTTTVSVSTYTDSTTIE